MAEIKSILYRLKKDGYNVQKRLGEGGYGYAYLLDNGRVLKVTTDEREAKASNLIIGRNFQNVAKIFRVWRYTKYYNWFFIEQEKLEKINKKEVSKWLQSDFNEFLNLESFLLQIFKNEINVSEAKSILNNYEDKEFYDFASDMINAAKDLLSLNIIWKDLHEDNIMKNGNIFKVIDLGFSKSPGRVTDVIENFNLCELIKGVNLKKYGRS